MRSARSSVVLSCLGLCLALAGCTAHSLRCTGSLQQINTPPPAPGGKARDAANPAVPEQSGAERTDGDRAADNREDRPRRAP